MQFVVNEWLLDYIVPNTAEEKIVAVNKFIQFISDNEHQIVIGRDNNFVSKFHQFMKQYGWHSDFKRRFKKLRQLLFYDSIRTLIIEKSDLANVDGNIESLTPEDDLYLVELAFSSEDKIIVTTDTRLKSALESVHNLDVILLPDFMRINHIDC